MRIVASFLLGVTLGLLPEGARADTSDPAAARAQLQQGFVLRQQGKCEEAVPHFVESIRLDRQPRALLNLADCEEKTGKLVSGQSHFVEARDLAQVQKLFDVRDAAEKLLASLEAKMPKLTITLASGAPTDTTVVRDGTELRAISIGTPLPTDPGSHIVVARSGGVERTYRITLAEGQSLNLEVTPVGGTPTGSASSAAHEPVEQPLEVAPIAHSDASSTAGPSSSRRAVEYALMGVAAAGLALGTIEGIRFLSKNSDADAACPGARKCATETQFNDYSSLHDSASNARTLSTVGFGIAGVALASAIVLMVTDHPHPTQASKITFGPAFSGRMLGFGVERKW